MKIIPAGMTALSIMLLALANHAYAQSSHIKVEPNVDWQKLASDDHNLSILGDDLMGDMIDYNNGGVTFEHTDIDIPGNSALSVAVKRRLTRGILYDKSESSGFGDWEIVAPRIVATTAPGANFRTGNRCSSINQFQSLNLRKYVRAQGTLLVVTPPDVRADQTLPHGYSQGIEIETPEYGSEKLLKSNVIGSLGPYTNTERYVTRSNFKVSCLSSIIGGGEGFLAKSPDGYTYRFDRFYERRTQDDVLSSYYTPDQARYRSIIAATEVTDVHGNWVKYEYDSADRLIRIHSNDGRDITLSYNGINRPISSVTANGRTWTYSYAPNSVTYDYTEWGVSGPYGSQPFDSLTEVMLPDGRKWYIGNAEMFRPSEVSGCTLDPTRSIGGDRYGLYMQHPSGMWGKFKFEMVRRRTAHDVLESRSARGGSNYSAGYIPNGTGVTLACPSTSSLDASIPRDVPTNQPTTPNVPAPPDEAQGNAPSTADITPTSQANLILYKAMPALTKKVLSKEIMEDPNSQVTPMVWIIDYEESPLVHYNQPTDIPVIPASDRTNWTKVTQPDGTENRYYYWWDTEPLGGQLKRDEVRVSPADTVPFRATDYDYVVQSPSVGVTNFIAAYPPASQLNPVHQTKVVTTQDGDSFTRETEYNLDITSQAYSFGKPTAVELTSNISTSPRRIETSYEHNIANWILGLPKTQSLNGTQAVSYTYNALGLKTAQSRYTRPNYYSFTYHPDGTPASATDADGHVVEASNWKRGSPQTMRRWLDHGLNGSENRWLTTSTVMDDNGWVTSFTDAKGHVTGYAYDDMGRIKTINPPGTHFNDTQFVYDFAATGDFPITQMITKGSATTTVEYDQLHRPRRVRQEDGNWSSVVETEYDNRNRAIFTSNPSSLIGARVKYDALGRPVANWLGDRASTTGPLLTITDYLSGHRVQTVDPSGNVTMRHLDGYAGPGGGDLLQIDEPLRRTILTRDDFGLLTLLRQEEIGGPKSVEQHFRYNADKRLCAHFVPEHGQSHFTYHPNGWLERSSKGETETLAGCAAPDPTLSTDRIYDSLGRVIATDFVPSGTLDIGNVYDDNGNLLETRRGVFNATNGIMPSATVTNSRHRLYDELNNVTSETQQIDGAPYAFPLTYTYDANGFRDSVTYPSANHYEWTNNGFGHQRHLRQGSYYYASGISYYPDGSLQSYTMGNGQIYTRHLDSLQRTHAIQSTGAGLSALNLTYTYDPNSRIASITDASTPGLQAAGKTHSVSNIAYDGLGQLTGADGWWGTGAYTYDGLGNMLSKAFDLGGPAERTVNFTYDYNPTNRLWISHDSLSDLHGGTSYRGLTYDSRGNMTGLGPLQMSYDLSDQMISTGGWASGISWTNGTFQYNGEGKRVQMTMNTASGGSAATGRNTFYVYDHAGRLVLSHKEHDGEGVERLYLESGEALGKWTGTELTYFHADHLGTPIRGTHGMGGTKTVGAEVFQDFNTPFGMQPVHGWHGTAGSGFNPATGPGSNCGVTGFTTHVRDCETGLQYMQARYMDPVISRFTTIDPQDYLSTQMPGMVNRYGYTLNDPMNGWDPDGEHPVAAALAGVGCALKTACRVASGTIVGGIAGGAGALFSETFDGKDGIRIPKIGTGVLKGAAAGGTFAKTGSLTKAGTAAAAIGGFEGAITSDGETGLEIAGDAAVQAGSDFISTVMGGGIGNTIAGEAFGEVAGSTAGSGFVTGAQRLTEIGEVEGEQGTPKQQLDTLLDPSPDMMDPDEN